MLSRVIVNQINRLGVRSIATQPTRSSSGWETFFATIAGHRTTPNVSHASEEVWESVAAREAIMWYSVSALFTAGLCVLAMIPLDSDLTARLNRMATGVEDVPRPAPDVNPFQEPPSTDSTWWVPPIA